MDQAAVDITEQRPVQPITSGRIIEQETDSPEAREKIERLLSVMLKTEQVDVPLVHHFAQGVYARQALIRKGTVIVGHIKKWSHINIIMAGDISIFTEEGEKRIVAPSVMVAAAGTKRVGYAHEDTIWISIVGTDDTTIEEVEDHFLAKSYEDYLAYRGALLTKEEGPWLLG